MEPNIYRGFSKEELGRLYEEYSASPEAVDSEKFKIYNDYAEIPLGEMAKKHAVNKEQLIEFSRWLGLGIGESSGRMGLPVTLRASKVLTPEIVTAFKNNSSLIGDILDFAKMANHHKESTSSPKLRAFMGLPREQQIRTAQKLIETVLKQD